MSVTGVVIVVPVIASAVSKDGEVSIRAKVMGFSWDCERGNWPVNRPNGHGPATWGNSSSDTAAQRGSAGCRRSVQSAIGAVGVATAADAAVRSL
ncbi:hypothetical protein GCM10027598_24260 [Amycolatopsis oliviviridis]